MTPYLIVLPHIKLLVNKIDDPAIYYTVPDTILDVPKKYI
jgi:hypothetical protein